MSEFQVERSLETSSPPQTIQPLFDVADGVWAVDIGDQTFVAPSLRDLQRQLPDVQIQDYFPDGFTAERVGFLKTFSRSGWYPTHQVPTSTKSIFEAERRALKNKKNLDDKFYAKHKREFEIIQAAAERSDKKKRSRVDHNMVLNLYAAGELIIHIAMQMGCTTENIHNHLQQARRDKDPRAKRRPIVRRHTKPSRHWTEDDDTKLRQLVSEGLSALQIGNTLNLSRNAIIGRCARRGIQLHGDPMRKCKKRIQLHDRDN